MWMSNDGADVCTVARYKVQANELVVVYWSILIGCDYEHDDSVVDCRGGDLYSVDSGDGGDGDIDADADADPVGLSFGIVMGGSSRQFLIGLFFSYATDSTLFNTWSRWKKRGKCLFP